MGRDWIHLFQPSPKEAIPKETTRNQVSVSVIASGRVLIELFWVPWPSFSASLWQPASCAHQQLSGRPVWIARFARWDFVILPVWISFLTFVDVDWREIILFKIPCFFVDFGWFNEIQSKPRRGLFVVLVSHHRLLSIYELCLGQSGACPHLAILCVPLGGCLKTLEVATQVTISLLYITVYPCMLPTFTKASAGELQHASPITASESLTSFTPK